MTNPVLECIKNRRSVRRFQEQPIDSQALEAVLEAGAWAASGMNLQGWRITAIQSPDLLAALDKGLQDYYLTLPEEDTSFAAMVEKAKKGESLIFHCPVYIVVTYDKDAHNAMADSALALGNMMLAAHSIGLATVWHNGPARLQETPQMLTFTQKLDVPENHRIFGTLALGHPVEMPKAPPRKDGVIRKL